MPFTNFPDGVSSFGVPVMPPAGYYRRVIWVGNTASSGLSTHPEGIGPTQPMSSLFGATGALALAASVGQNQPVQIRCLRGHAENVSAADMASDTGTEKNIHIVSEGWGDERATLTWTAAGSTWLFDTTGIWLDNFVLNLEPGTGTVSVAAPITISAASCRISNCRMRTSTDASNLATIPIAITASSVWMWNNEMYGATAGECTTMVDVSGNARLHLLNNIFSGATSNTGVGIVRFKATAPTDMVLYRNIYINRKAASTMAVTGVAATSGISKDETFCYLDNTTTTMHGTSPGNMFFDNAKVVNLAGENAMIATVVST